MARPLRIEFPGAVYHITARGNAKQDIFLDNKDFLDFLYILCSVVKRYNWILHAYCLMSNHYHLLVETPEGNLSIGMRQLNGTFTQQFNRRHKRVGHLFQGRYKAILVDKDSYLLELCRYIVLNPVRAGIVRSPKYWQWSNYRETAGYGREILCLTREWTLLQFGRKREGAEEQYRQFVHEGLKEGAPWEGVKGQIYLGNDEFLKRIDTLIKGGETLKEVPKAQRYITKPELKDIFKHKGGKVDPLEAYEAHVRYGYTLKEIAEHLGVHYATISRALKRLEER
ncbi:MAG: transposase [Actinomycetota bacterium]|nr:transposase [Actinomycetota bacterium]